MFIVVFCPIFLFEYELTGNVFNGVNYSLKNISIYCILIQIVTWPVKFYLSKKNSLQQMQLFIKIV